LASAVPGLSAAFEFLTVETSTLPGQIVAANLEVTWRGGFIFWVSSVEGVVQGFTTEWR